MDEPKDYVYAFKFVAIGILVGLALIFTVIAVDGPNHRLGTIKLSNK